MTQLGSPPSMSSQCLIPVRFIIVSRNSLFSGPPNILSANVACTGPSVPWYAAIEAAPFASCWAVGGEKPSAYEIAQQSTATCSTSRYVRTPSSYMRTYLPSSILRPPRLLRVAPTMRRTVPWSRASTVPR